MIEQNVLPDRNKLISVAYEHISSHGTAEQMKLPDYERISIAENLADEWRAEANAGRPEGFAWWLVQTTYRGEDVKGTSRLKKKLIDSVQTRLKIKT